MYNIAKKNKLYLGVVVLLTALMVSLNFCKAIYQCALVFVSINLIINTIAAKWNKQYALNGLLSAVILGFALSYQAPYYLNGKLINLLALGSLASVVISMYVSTNLFVSLTNKMSFASANLLAISVAAIIDAFAMSAFFILENSFALNKIASIGATEILWKLLYAAISSMLITAIMYFVNNQRQAIIR